MALTPGTTLASYEIVSTLGAGGMGEVYRATDTKLGREVAIKILLDEVAGDPDRMARFEREARVLASLNHGNIATLYGFEQAGDTHFLVMELVEGETLADRIARGPIPAGQAVEIFTEIAQGLDAAHEKGVIHRDLKPANVKLGGDGEPLKILDFGLAKAAATDAGDSVDSSLSMSPTLTLAATQRGEVMGTAAYMSPEQAKGRTVDRRTDVWAFGACLLEALSGRRAFKGEDASELMASVLMLEPEWDALPDSTPKSLRRLMERCLAKDPRDRLRDIGDVLYELRHAGAEPAEEEMQPAPAGAPVGLRAPRVAAITALVALAAGAAGFLLRPSEEPPAPVRTLLTGGDTPQVTIDPFLADLAITPDGQTVVYQGNDSLFVRRVGELSGRPLAGSEGGIGTFLSPDGEWVGFFDNSTRTLKKVSILGGPALKICEAPNFVAGATWGTDNTIIFTLGDGAVDLYRVDANGGEPEKLPLVVDEEITDVRWPAFIGDTKLVLLTLFLGLNLNDDARIGLYDLETGELSTLLSGGGRALYSPTGHLLYGVDNALRTIVFDPDRREVSGNAIPVLEGILTKTASGMSSFALADDGSLVHTTGGTASDGTTIDDSAALGLVWIGGGATTETSGLAGNWASPSISPDGKLLAAANLDDGDIWIRDLERGTTSRFTLDPALDGRPVWTPDGATLYFASGRAGTFAVHRKPSDGSGAAELVRQGEGPFVPVAVTPDGETLIMSSVAPVPAVTALDLTADGATEDVVFPLDHVNAALSPDGRWLAYQTNNTGRSEIYVRPFPDLDGGIWQISADGGWQPVWSRDGTRLFFMGRGERFEQAAIDTDAGFRPGTPQLMFQLTAPKEGIMRWAAHPDGERFLTLVAPEGLGTADIALVQHFGAELERLLPGS